jgi:hypothetical protein
MIPESFCNRRYPPDYPNPGVPTESDQPEAPQDLNPAIAKNPRRSPRVCPIMTYSSDTDLNPDLVLNSSFSLRQAFSLTLKYK